MPDVFSPFPHNIRAPLHFSDLQPTLHWSPVIRVSALTFRQIFSLIQPSGLPVFGRKNIHIACFSCLQCSELKRVELVDPLPKILHLPELGFWSDTCRVANFVAVSCA
jgi:hypothetical protein